MSYSVVASTAVRNALTPAVDDQVFNKETGQIERFVGNSNWVVDEDRPTGTINPRKFQDSHWIDTATGLSTVASGQVYYVTQSDIQAHPEWRGKYYAGIDTRDDVCLQEALLEAYGPQTAGGQYHFDGSPGKTGIWLGVGVWMCSRKKFFLNTLGAFIHGEGKEQSLIRGVMPDTTVLWADGIHSSRLQQFGVELTQPYSGAHGDGWSANGSFDSSFHHPVVDIDWLNPSSLGVPNAQSVTADYTARQVVSADMPYVDRAGSNWAINSLRGKKIVVIDDPGQPNAVGQVRRIAWNTATRIYISGRWDFPPSAQAKFLLDPVHFGWARWHGDGFGGVGGNKLVDWWTNFNAMPNGVNVNGMTLRRFGFNNNVSTAYPLTSRTITSHTERCLLLDANWPTNLVPAPRRADNPNDSFLTGNMHAEPPQPQYQGCNYTIGGTLYDSNGGANAITSSNDNTLIVQGNPWTGDKRGGYLEVVSAAADTGLLTVTSMGDGTQITVSGMALRPVGSDIGMRLFVRSGSDNGQYAHVKDSGNNGTNANWWRIDRGLSIGVGTTVELIDPVKGQIIPIVTQSGQNAIGSILEWTNGLFYQHYWTKLPRPGDTVVVHGRYGNINLHGCVFDHFSAATNGWGDLAWAWARTGDGSMGSETSFYDCAVSGNRVGIHTNGQNVINLNWHGGAGAGRQAMFYCPRGWMNIYGPGIGGDNDPLYGPRQIGTDIVMQQSNGLAVQIVGAYTENPSLFGGTQPAILMRCNIGNPLGGYSLTHTWTEGQFWKPTNHRGRQWRCVEVFGNASTAAITDPSVSNTIFGDDYSPVVKLVDGSGNGATFVRCDFAGVYASKQGMIIGGSFGQAILGNSVSVVGATFSRPDFLRQTDAGDSEASPGQFTNHEYRLVLVDPSIVDGSYSGGPLPWDGLQNRDTNFPPPRYENAHWFSRALMLLVGYQGQSQLTGLVALARQEWDPNASAVLLALADFQDQSHPVNPGQANPTVFGKLPRAGTDQTGTAQRIAGGQGTGAGHGGSVDIEVAPAGTSGATANSLVKVARFDDDVTTGNTRFLLWDVGAGALKRVSIGTVDSGGAGYKVLRVPN